MALFCEDSFILVFISHMFFFCQCDSKKKHSFICFKVILIDDWCSSASLSCVSFGIYKNNWMLCLWGVNTYSVWIKLSKMYLQFFKKNTHKIILKPVKHDVPLLFKTADILRLLQGEKRWKKREIYYIKMCKYDWQVYLECSMCWVKCIQLHCFIEKNITKLEI